MRFMEIIGVGGMAYVYKAYDAIDDRIVAIKILREEYVDNEEYAPPVQKRIQGDGSPHPSQYRASVYDVSFARPDAVDCYGVYRRHHPQGVYRAAEGSSNGRKRSISPCRSCARCSTPTTRGLSTGISSRRTSCCLQDGTIKVTDFGIARFSRSEYPHHHRQGDRFGALYQPGAGQRRRDGRKDRYLFGGRHAL